MGGIFATWFLNLQSQEWKDRYIDSFIALSTPWGGSTDTLQAVTSGYTFGISFISPLVVRPEQRTIETNYLMLPNARVWSANKHFVLSDERSYTASRTDMNDMFRRIGVSTERYNYVRDANEQNGASGVMPPNPGVLTYCIYGDGLDTSDVLDFRGGNFPDSKPRIQTVSGDGTVSYESLSACREWNLGDREIKLQSASHSGVLQDDKGIQEILKILLRNK
ncbi:unnamed protein product [Clavelina lepadiformis]|uniref:Uncharacterized protein n=1 Tax=Clavelina lepadiformis TaxID=159417 RepID=A0ABP0FEV6_CLALP